MASPLRLRVLRELYDGPLTNSEVAERLGRDKATVLHHVRVLVDAGFLEPLPVRRGPRGSRERPYRSTGKSWWLDVEDAPDRPRIAEAMVRAFLEEVTRPGADPSPTRLALRLSPGRRADLEARLDAIVREFAALPPEPDGDPSALFLAFYRRPSAVPADSPAPAP